MELPHVGKNCALKECNRLDFLPVTCDACKQLFCVEHYQYDNHKCEKARDKDIQVPVCPLCMEPVGIIRGQLPDVTVSEHIDRYCKSNDQIKRTKLPSSPVVSSNTRLQKCSFKLCKQKDVIYLECQDCKTKFCVKHRHPSDHLCSGPPPKSFGSNVADNWNSFRGSCSSSATSGMEILRNKTQQLSKSGQAALQRMTTKSHRHSSGKPSSVPSSLMPRGDQAAIRSLQGELSEHEALAIAMGESMTNPAQQLTTTDESQDAELARAIHQSELEARERRFSNNSASGNYKSNCVVS